jgi:hypothetical protein
MSTAVADAYREHVEAGLHPHQLRHMFSHD